MKKIKSLNLFILAVAMVLTVAMFTWSVGGRIALLESRIPGIVDTKVGEYQNAHDSRYTECDVCGCVLHVYKARYGKPTVAKNTYLIVEMNGIDGPTMKNVTRYELTFKTYCKAHAPKDATLDKPDVIYYYGSGIELRTF